MTELFPEGSPSIVNGAHLDPDTVLRWTGSNWELVDVDSEDKMEVMYKEQRTLNVMEILNNVKGLEFESIEDFLNHVDKLSAHVVYSGTYKPA